jgi:hypothetical protein
MRAQIAPNVIKSPYLAARFARRRRLVSIGATNRLQTDEEYDMQCYQYLAAITAVANTIESIPGIPHKLPHSVIADWMEDNDIEAQDVLFATREQIDTIVESLLRDNQPRILHAA